MCRLNPMKAMVDIGVPLIKNSNKDKAPNKTDLKKFMAKEKPYCINCGNDSHCKKTLKRKESEHIGDKKTREWVIEVCRRCHCANCEKD